MSGKLNLQILSKGEIETIFEKCVFFLSNNGVKVDHKEALKILDQAGALVDLKRRIVRFPKDLIDTALDSAPKNISLGDMILPHPEGSFHVMAGAGTIMSSDPGSDMIRYSTLSDLREALQLQELLDEISIAAYPLPDDVPKETMDVHTVRAAFENTSKNLALMPNKIENIEYVFELIRVITDDYESSRNRSSMLIIQCLLSPFVYKEFDVEVIIQACRNRQPLLLATCATAGASAPFTIAGHVMVGAAEILSSLVMCQMIEPGIPVIANPMLGRLDLYKGMIFSGVEKFLASAAIVQFMRDAFHIPTATGAFATNVLVSDEQCGLEKAINSLLITSSDCDILVHAGSTGNSLCLSPLQLIIDDALASLLRRISSGVEVNDDTLAWQEILGVDPGGEFLGLRHTLNHADDDVRLRLLRDVGHEPHRMSDIKDLRARALEQYYELKKEMKPLQIPEDIQKELDLIVKKADKNLTK